MFMPPQRPLHELYLTCHGELEAVLFSRVNCRETAADLCQEAIARLYQMILAATPGLAVKQLK